MTTSHPVEIELKLALPPQQAATFIKLMARRRSVPAQQVLRTRYFDTPDFALSAQGIALRVRRVGRRWVQTLKTEGVRRGGLSQRAEYEMAITRGTPDWSRFPAEALAWVPEALRAQLLPVFETDFSRTAWQLKGPHDAAIEVALDVGEVRTLKGMHADARSQPICEIELELKSGQPDALFELAQGWARQLDCLPLDSSKAERGVRLAHDQNPEPIKSVALTLDRQMSVEAGFAATCQSCLTQFQANLPGVLASGDIEYVHQARVALRRLRAALRLFRRVCVPPDELMEGLRTLTTALGPARDWDVLCSETLPPIAPHCPDADAWQQGCAVLEAHRAGVRATMQADLLQAHPGAWLLAFQRWLLQRGWRSSPAGEAAPEAQRFVQLSPLLAWARRALRKGQRRVVRDARDFANLQAAQRHVLRIAIKRQRYAAEFFQTLFAGPRQDRTLEALRNAQDSLGRARDSHMAWQLLIAARADTGSMGPFVLGWLAARQAGATQDESAGHVNDCLKLKPYFDKA
jgi:triphosphatase